MLLATVGFVEKLLPLERDYFLWINQHRSDFLDTFMYIYSDKYTWIPLALLLLGVLLFKTGWKQIILFVVCGLLIGLLCDLVPAELIKPFFGRLRPSHHPDFRDFVDLVQNHRGGQFGFISNHATNGFGIAAFTALIFRYRYYTITTYIWVLITAYSRIYLGVHFITDIIGGFVWGTLVGVGVYFLFLYGRKIFMRVPKKEFGRPLLSKRRALTLVFGIWATILIVAIYALLFPIVE